MRILAVSSLAGLVSASSNSSVKKVVDLLDGMKGKVSAELETGKAEAEEYSDWCIKTITETEADVKYGSEKVDELAAAAEKGAGVASAKSAEAADLAQAIGKAQAAQKKAEAERKEENKAFMAEEAELVEADTMLGKAYSVLKRALKPALVQVDGTPSSSETQHAEEVVSALGAIIDSAWVSQQDASHIKAFLQEEQPQASTSNYDSKSGGILDAIQQMQEKNAETLSALREKEMKGRHSFEMVVQDLVNKAESKADQMAAAKQAGAKAAAEAKEAESKGSDAEETLAADKKELAETKSGCDSYAKEWAAREAEATEEIGVIGQAIEILSGKFGSPTVAEEEAPAFLQVTEQAEFSRREKASSLLRKMSRTYNAYGLMQLAQAANDDPFVKVRGMINDMITKLEEQARKEASKEAKCKADKQKGAKDLKIKKNDFNKLLSRSDATEAKFAKLGSEIADLGNQLSELAASVKEATKMRNEETAENASVVKDASESIEALNGAITVLSEFYGKDAPALVQTGAKKQSDTAAVILEILQTAQEDFEKIKQETEASESKAADKYDKDMQAAQVAKAKKTAQKEGKQNEKGTVKSQMAQISEDLADAEKALQAAQDFLKGVMEACANKAMSFEERQAKRAAEIAGLKEALTILSPEAEFLQTGKFLAKN